MRGGTRHHQASHRISAKGLGREGAMSNTTRTEEPRLMLRTFLGLIPFGLVAVATIIMFSVASFFSLYTREGTSTDSGYGDRGFEVEPARFGGFPYIHPNRPPVLAGTELVGSAAEATASTSSDSPGAHDMRLPDLSRTQLSSETLALSASEGSTTQDAPLNGTGQTRVPEVGGAHSVFEPLSASASEGRTGQDASLNGTAQTRVPEVSGAQSVFEPLSASASEGSAGQDASLNGTAQTRVPEVSGAQPVSEPLSRSASGGGAAQGASLSGIVPTLSMPAAAQRDRVFREFATHHDQRGNFGTSPGAALSRPTSATSQRATPSPGAGGQVWVNTSSKVYHCPGTRWYGKTTQGGFMSETQARAQGARSDHGNACTS
jgi:hypothetical protein